MTNAFESKTVKVCVDHEPQYNQIDVDANDGYDPRRPVGEVVAELMSEGWAIVPVLGRDGRLDLYCGRPVPIPVPLEPG